MVRMGSKFNICSDATFDISQTDGEIDCLTAFPHIQPGREHLSFVPAISALICMQTDECGRVLTKLLVNVVSVLVTGTNIAMSCAESSVAALGRNAWTRLDPEITLASDGA